MGTRELFIALVGVLFGAQAGCGERSQAQSHAAAMQPEVRTVAVTRAPLSAPVRAVGHVAEQDEVTIAFAIGGELQRVNVDQGDTFTRGALLAALDRRAINAQAAQARASHKKAARDLARVRTLQRSGSLAQAPLDDAATAMDVARSTVVIAEDARANARIEAAFDGVVLRRLVEPGEVVGPGQPILVVAQSTRPLVVRANLTDRDVVRVRVGDIAQVVLDALPGRHLAGRVTEVAPAASMTNGTFPIEVELEGDVPRHAGLVARVVIEPSARELLYSLPLGAIVEAEGSRASLFVVRDGKAELRDVSVAFFEPPTLAVGEGLSDGDRVIVSGGAHVREGDHVRELVAVRGQP